VSEARGGKSGPYRRRRATDSDRVCFRETGADRFPKYRTRRAGHSRDHDQGHLIGYARVSTTEQDTATQEAKLKTAGCTLVRTETVSGGSRDGRNELASILDFSALAMSSSSSSWIAWARTRGTSSISSTN
jgi:hypothetical protein